MKNQFITAIALFVFSSSYGMTYIVSDTTDTGTGSLRDAVDQAESNAGPDTIMFSVATDMRVIALTSDMLTITEDLLINGNGTINTIIDGGKNRRLFTVGTAGITVTIANIHLQNGQEAFAQGGCVLVTNGTVNLINCEISGNSSNNSGGAVQINTAGTINMTNCYLHNNSTTGNSGAFRSYGNVNINIYGCTFAENTGIEAVTLSGNAGKVSMTNCTVFKNNGKGVTVFAKDAVLSNNTVASNTGTGVEITEDVTLNNNIMYGNTNQDVYADAITPATIAISNNANVVGQCNGNQCPSSWFSSDDPNLSASLGNNGGPTPTVSLEGGGTAINNGIDSLAPSHDQRGYLRLGTSDIGAYEFGGLISTRENSMAWKNDMVVYPNPTKGVINIVYPEGVDYRHARLQVMNFLGEVVVEANGEKSIDLSDYGQQMYLIRISSEDDNWVSKVLVE